MTDDERESIYRLWDELAGSSAAQVDQACRRLMQTLASWIGADNAGWLAAVRLLHEEHAARDAMNGWRVKAIQYLYPPTDAELLAASRIVKSHNQQPGLTTVAALRGSGAFRVHRLYDGFVDLDQLKSTAYYRAYYEAFGVDDRLWVGVPINADAESYFVFDKRRTESRFSQRDAELAAFAIRGLGWFCRQLFYSHGLIVAQEPLTPKQRQVVQLLLTEKPEKQIAAELGLSPHTTHGYVKEIYRKYGVKGRAGLMAIWLSSS